MDAAFSFDGGVGEIRISSLYLNGLNAFSFGVWIKSNITDNDSGVMIFAIPDDEWLQQFMWPS